MTALPVDAGRHVQDRCTKKLPEARPRLRQASGRFRGLRGRPQLPHVADVHGGAAMAAMAAPGGGRGVCYGGGRPPPYRSTAPRKKGSPRPDGCVHSPWSGRMVGAPARPSPTKLADLKIRGSPWSQNLVGARRPKTAHRSMSLGPDFTDMDQAGRGRTGIQRGSQWKIRKLWSGTPDQAQILIGYESESLPV